VLSPDFEIVTTPHLSPAFSRNVVLRLCWVSSAQSSANARPSVGKSRACQDRGAAYEIAIRMDSVALQIASQIPYLNQERASVGASRRTALVSSGHVRRPIRTQCSLRGRQLCCHVSRNQEQRGHLERVGHRGVGEGEMTDQAVFLTISALNSLRLGAPRALSAQFVEVSPPSRSNLDMDPHLIPWA